MKIFFEKLLEYSVNATSSSKETEELRLRKKQFLVGIAASFFVSLVAGVLFEFVGLGFGALIAFGVCFLDVGMVVVLFYAPRAFWGLLNLHVFLSLLFPFLTQCYFGGFGQTGGLGLWAIVAPLVAIGQEMPFAWLWLVAFVGLEWGSLATEKYWVAHGVHIPPAYSPFLLAVNLAGMVSILCFANSFVLRLRRQVQERLREEHQRFIQEHQKTERLLRNILPDVIAEKLKAKHTAISQSFPDASVLFADIAGFTQFSSDKSATEVVEMLNGVFGLFDILAEEFGLEKIKTIGDAYMAVGNLPKPNSGHLESMADMALAMQQVFQQKLTGPHELELRVGIHCGPVVAGVIGRRKFSYDLWGDTVNVAQRMESNSLPGRIQVSETVHERLQKRYVTEERGFIEVKGKGELKAFWLVGKREGTLKLPNLNRPQVGTNYF
ncbi:MAG TPA: adenylate/guanylate cyclase domain-containing protein [bacterium]